MKIGPFSGLQRMRNPASRPSDSILIAAYHPRTSITWRWLLEWTPARALGDVRRGIRFDRRNQGIAAHCDLWVLGRIQIVTQHRLEKPEDTET